jgi:hypothetical protein
MRAGHATWARVPPVIDTIAAAQQEELEKEIEELKAEARAGEREIEELVGRSPFYTI